VLITAKNVVLGGVLFFGLRCGVDYQLLKQQKDGGVDTCLKPSAPKSKSKTGENRRELGHQASNEKQLMAVIPELGVSERLLSAHRPLLSSV